MKGTKQVTSCFVPLPCSLLQHLYNKVMLLQCAVEGVLRTGSSV